MSDSGKFLLLELTFSRCSILLAITICSMLDCMIIEGSYNTVSFYTFIESVVAKLHPGAVIVMDNCSIHKSDEVHNLIESQ